MSNDLIRRKEVLSALEKLFADYNISFGGSSGGFSAEVPKAIMDIPVAYDVDHVVEQLEEHKKTIINQKERDILNTIAKVNARAAVEEDIEIVKSGWN